MTPTLSYQLVYAPRTVVRTSIPLHLVAATALLVILGFKVWLKTEITELGYAISSAREETIILDSKRRELELKRSILLRPDTLKRDAEARLGLSTLNPDQARRVGY